ncbi:hypothetical protein PHLCEN_2v2330 [Hermanssonia centrifuga]|uniref:DUF676 domain-containing protein n=1 Tax=Hermanssonia centrifuga TaxID=98765 RepID=A0A2R6RMD0_9APHY|nr:hypothetical protein PHLCEN_2v2330 [Hermanssonia centrifuga]
MASTSATSNTIHLLVLTHGMWGSPNHLDEMSRVYKELRGQEGSKAGPDGEHLHILVAQANREKGTYDGVDWGGERVAEEVMDEIKKLEDEGKKVTRFSVTGYSMGGLVARYLVGVLHQRKFFDTVTPVNFMTVATPHIGLIRYPTFRSSLFAYLGPRLLSRTGEQFYTVDEWSPSGRPLLAVMADPDRVFYQALNLFPHIRFYANAVNDTTVAYPSAAVEIDDPFADHEFNGIHIELDETYSPIIKSYISSDSPPPPPPKPRAFSKKWLKGMQPQIPPAFRLAFPYNVLVIVALPVLFPTLLTLIVVRLSLDSRSSRSRIKLLESDESYRERLANVIGHLEKQVEDAVLEYMDDPGDSETTTDLSETPNTAVSTTKPGKCEKKEHKVVKPQVTAVQKKMIKSLNTLPNLKKELVFIHPVMNSHAVIISRDVKRFKFHAEGEGVLRHLADNFII